MTNATMEYKQSIIIKILLRPGYFVWLKESLVLRNFFRFQHPLKINKTTKTLRDKLIIVAKAIQNKFKIPF